MPLLLYNGFEVEVMNQEKVGKFISQLRKEYNMTQQELADKLQITDKAVSKWENGRCMPDISFLEQLSSIFQVTVKEILNGERTFRKKELIGKEDILVVENVSKSFGRKIVLKDISITIKEGEILGIIGPNGAGKTTLIKTILSFYKKDTGSIKILGYDNQKSLEDALSKVGSIVENPDMYEHLSGRKNLEITALINSIKDKKYIEEMIQFVGLKDRIDDKVKKYSLGMKQRLGLANALIKKPKLLILDEPTNGLDPHGIRNLREMLKKLSNESMSILICSHILSEVENICDRIVIIDKGKIVDEFGIEEVKYKNKSLEEEYFLKTDKFEEEYGD